MVDLVCIKKYSIMSRSSHVQAYLAVLYSGLHISSAGCRDSATGIANLAGALLVANIFLGTSNASTVQPVVAAQRSVMYRCPPQLHTVMCIFYEHGCDLKTSLFLNDKRTPATSFLWQVHVQPSSLCVAVDAASVDDALLDWRHTG